MRRERLTIERIVGYFSCNIFDNNGEMRLRVRLIEIIG